MDTPKSIVPDELKAFWDDESSKIWQAMTFGEQTFCLEVLRGKKKTHAYQKAFPNVTADAAGAAACRMFKHPRVKAYFELHRDAALEDLFITRNSLRSIAQGEVIETEYNGEKMPIVPKASDITAAAVQLARMSGLNAPEKVQDDRFAQLLNHMNRNKTDGKETKS